jgi:enediyne biosynthesis protein E4
VVTYYVNGKEVTLSGKDELQKQIPLIKKKFIYAADFAKASLDEIFTADKINKAVISKADYFDNTVFINNGNLNFTTKPMPWQAQLSCLRSALLVNANNDTLPDVLLAGNYYGNNIHKGRNDADYGTLLINKGNGNFEYENLNGFLLKGEIRHLNKIEINGKEAIVAAKNNGGLMVFQFKK